MEVNFRLDGPSARAKFFGDIQSNAWSPETQLIVNIQEGRGIKLIAQTLSHHGLIVELLLVSKRLGRGHLQRCASHLRNGLNRPHGSREQVFFRQLFFSQRLLLLGQLKLSLLSQLKIGLELRQVFERF